ncbi:hypothetical protein CAJAP_07029 [Camponotus japonicus]
MNYRHINERNKQLFVPWTSEFDKVILKKTIVMFRMLDEEWTSLAPNRRDHRPYRGSCCENENFYGGRSVIFCVPAEFFEKKAIDVDVQLYVWREICKYFEMDSCQNVGFATVSVDDLLNGIAKQMRERNELSEHLSDLYKQQIISRSTTGTYNLLDENFRNTAATISLYIRISCLGKCLVTEITRIESGMYGAFCARREPDKEQYLARQLTSDELQSGHWDVRDLPRIPRGRLVCRCEELRKKDFAVDLAARRKRRREPTAHSVNADRFVTTPVTTNAARDAVGIAKTRIPIAKAPADVAIIKREEALADYGALGDADVDALADAQERIVVTDAAAIAADTAAIAADTAAIAANTASIAADAADAIRRKVPIDDLGALGKIGMPKNVQLRERKRKETR